MISTDFAPNETNQDAIAALKLLFKPWLWQKRMLDPKVETYLASYFPKHYFTYFLSGRAAEWAVLKNLALPPNSEILVVGFTCEAVVLPIKELGYTVKYIDIDTQTFSVNLEDLKKRLSSKTKVLILQHTFGITPHRKETIELCKKKNIVVIEDLAHGFDEELFKTDTENTIKLLSFGRTKTLSSINGGAIATRDVDFHNKLEKIAQNLPNPSSFMMLRMLLYKPAAALIKTTYSIGLGKALHKLMLVTGVINRELSQKERQGDFDTYLLKKYPYPLSVLLGVQLVRFKETQHQRKIISTLYYKALQTDLRQITGLSRFPYLTASPQSREEVLKKCRKENIFIGRWYHYTQSSVGECPQADNISRRLINLPTLVSEVQAKYIIDLIKSA